jgi:hypothetical protein
VRQEDGKFKASLSYTARFCLKKKEKKNTVVVLLRCIYQPWCSVSSVLSISVSQRPIMAKTKSESARQLYMVVSKQCIEETGLG